MDKTLYDRSIPYMAASPSPLGKSPSYEAQYRNANDPSNTGMKHTDMFKSSQWRDVWAAILFVANFVLFIAICSYFACQIDFESLSDTGAIQLESSSIRYLAGVLIASVGLSIVVTIGYVALMIEVPEFMVLATFCACIGIYVVGGIFAAMASSFILALFSFLLAGAMAICLFLWRRRIPFAALMLKTAVSVMRSHPATLVLPLGSLLLSMANSVIFVLGIVGISAYFQTNSGKVQTLVAYLLFCMYWNTQVIQNVVHTTIAGVFGTFYFLEGSGQTIINPTLSSLKRSLTYSFGSIAFGSLIVALIQTIRALLRSATDDNSVIGAIVDCILGWFEALVAYFNYYAYVQVSLYGKPFIRAAKDTWSLVKTRGVDAVINDSLVGNVLLIGTLVVGFGIGMIAYLFARLREKQSYSTGVGLIAGLIASIFMFVVTEIISSGVATTFVCLAEDPQALRRTKPELYAKIAEVYPEVTLHV